MNNAYVKLKVENFRAQCSSLLVKGAIITNLYANWF